MPDVLESRVGGSPVESGDKALRCSSELRGSQISPRKKLCRILACAGVWEDSQLQQRGIARELMRGVDSEVITADGPGAWFGACQSRT